MINNKITTSKTFYSKKIIKTKKETELSVQESGVKFPLDKQEIEEKDKDNKFIFKYDYRENIINKKIISKEKTNQMKKVLIIKILKKKEIKMMNLWILI